jgi:hypothetical protein
MMQRPMLYTGPPGLQYWTVLPRFPNNNLLKEAES